MATGYLAELIEAFFRDGERYGIPIDYFREQEPLGTVGALAMLDGLDDDVPRDERRRPHRPRLRRVARGATRERRGRDDRDKDARRPISLGVLVRRHRGPSGSPATEKPKIDYEASMGIYCFAPPRSHNRAGEHARLPGLVLLAPDGGGKSAGYESAEYRLDIGCDEDDQPAPYEFEKFRSRLLPDE